MSDTLQLHGLQHTRLPCPSPSPKACLLKLISLSQCCHPTVCPLLSPPPPAFNLSQHQGLFQWVSSSHQMAKILELQLQHQIFKWIFRTDFLSEWLVWSPYNPKDSQESFSMPQFESISSSVFCLLYGPTLTSMYDYWQKQALTIQTFVNKVMSLPFNTLSR